MSIDAYPDSPLATLHDVEAAEEVFDRESSRAENAITLVAVSVTVVFVSFAAVLMAMD